MSPRRTFAAALVASVALHLGVLTGGVWLLPALDAWLAPAPPPPLEARLVMAPEPVAMAKARPVAKRPRPAPAASPQPSAAEPVPLAEAPPAAERVAAPAAEPTPVLAAAPSESESLDAAEAVVAAEDVEFTLPRQVRIRYVIRMGEAGLVVGQASHEWRHDGSRYQLRSTAETVGLAALFKPATVVHVSEGDLVGGDLRPSMFRVERDGGTSDWASFDWPNQRLAMSGGERQATLEANAQDMVSMFAHLAVIRLEPGAVISFPVTTGKKVERYDFTVLDYSQINTPLGERPCVHLRNQRAGGDSTELWLATDLPARLPLRIRHVDRHGIVFDQVADLMEFDQSAKQQEP